MYVLFITVLEDIWLNYLMLNLKEKYGLLVPYKPEVENNTLKWLLVLFSVKWGTLV